MHTYVDEKTGIKRCRNGDAKPAWIVKDVTPREDHTLLVTFICGEEKVIDMKPLIEEGKMYKHIKDIGLFMQAHIVGPTVAWNDEIDIAPEFLYENGKTL